MAEEEAEATNEADVTQGRKLVRLNDNPPLYYVNNTEVGMTNWDVSLRLSRIVKADAEALYVRDEAVVTMSLHHAKAVALILGGYLAQYEQLNGVLPVPFAGAGMAPGHGGGKYEADVPIDMFSGAPEESEAKAEKEAE